MAEPVTSEAVTSESANWQPLLEGDEAAKAWQAIEAVAEALRPVEKVLPTLRSGSAAGGSAGLALFFTYLAMARDDSAMADVAVAYFDHATDELANTVMLPGLYGGFSGVAWVDAHFDGRLFSADGDEAEEDDEESVIDQTLLTLLGAEPWTQDYDLIGGLVGYGVYSLEGVERRGPGQGLERRILERVVEHLAGLATPTDQGTTWFTPVELLPPHQAKTFPEGYYNLGLAHGMPAVISVLGRACAAGVKVEVARPLLDGAVRWLLTQRLGAGEESCFGHYVIPGQEAKPSRLAWCYGDPGVAVALLGAALAVGEETWKAEALAIARAAAARGLDTAGVQDAGLCHGSAGVAQLFLRMARATGDAELAKAARFWLGETLKYWRPGEGVGGFFAWSRGEDGEEPSWQDDPGFLTGSAGIGLALLAAVSDVEPAWDRLLLADLPVLA